jgi:hypothetical protein
MLDDGMGLSLMLWARVNWPKIEHIVCLRTAQAIPSS